MSFTSFLADPEALRDRGYWMVNFHLVDPSGAAEVLRFSNRGGGTGPVAITVDSITIPANSAYRARVEKAPSIVQSLWTPGSILSSSIPSFGEVVLGNRDGGLDQYRNPTGYRWVRAEVFYADQYDIPNTIGLVFDGKVKPPQYSGGSVTISLAGRESDFSVPTSTRVYRGTSYGLELAGDRVADFGTASALNLTGSMTWEEWIWIDTAMGVGTIQHLDGWLGGTTIPWKIWLLANGTLRILGHIGGVLESVTSTTALTVQKPYHVAIVVSGRNVTFHFWDDDAQTLTTNTFANAFSSATRQGQSGSPTVQLRTDASTSLRVWHDDKRLWNVARTSAEIATDRHRPLTSGSIPASCVWYLRMDDGSGTTVTDSSVSAVNGTITGTGTSQYLWMMEGGPELAGKPKLDTWGYKFGAAPVLVSSIHKAFQVAGSGSVQSIVTHEGGFGHTMDANAASLRAFMTTTPAGGNSLPYLARGYFRLGSSPTLPVSATVQGYNGGALGFVSAAGTVTRDIITRRGPKISDPSGLDTSSFTAYGTASSAQIGITLYAPNSSAEHIGPVLDQVNIGGLGWWGYVGSSILFHVERFAGPDVTADYNLYRQIIEVEDVHPPPPVVYEVVVKYRKNDVAMSDDQVSGSVKGTIDWAQWTLPWREKKDSDETLRAAYTGESGISLPLETALYNDADAQTLATSLLSAIKGVREVLIVTVIAAGLQITIGMTVTLKFEYQDGTQRLGLDGTRKYLVIATEIVLQEGRMKLTVWG